jgi:two-component sensor histidine kinase
MSIAGLHGFRTFGSFIEDLKRGEVVAIDDIMNDPRTRHGAEALLAIGIRALLNMPVMERGQLVGVTFVHHAHDHTFTVEELAFIRAVGDRMESAVARLRAEERQRVLNHELSHRLKNTLAMVLSIATQTLRSVSDQGPVEVFEKRVLALSSAHDILLRQDWSSAPLAAVVGAVLSNFAQQQRFDIAGPEIALGARAALSTALLLHELGTNAAKYGALSRDSGRVAVTWRVDGEGDEQELALTWSETGGPPVTPPTRRGFGSRLIRMGLVGTGGVEIGYPASGLHAEMRAPLLQISQA